MDGKKGQSFGTKKSTATMSDRRHRQAKTNRRVGSALAVLGTVGVGSGVALTAMGEPFFGAVVGANGVGLIGDASKSFQTGRGRIARDNALKAIARKKSGGSASIRAKKRGVDRGAVNNTSKALKNQRVAAAPMKSDGMVNAHVRRGKGSKAVKVGAYKQTMKA